MSNLNSRTMRRSRSNGKLHYIKKRSFRKARVRSFIDPLFFFLIFIVQKSSNYVRHYVRKCRTYVVHLCRTSSEKYRLKYRPTS